MDPTKCIGGTWDWGSAVCIKITMEALRSSVREASDDVVQAGRQRDRQRQAEDGANRGFVDPVRRLPAGDLPEGSGGEPQRLHEVRAPLSHRRTTADRPAAGAGV